MILVCHRHRHRQYEQWISHKHKMGWGVWCFNCKVVGHCRCWVSANRLHLGLEGDRLLQQFAISITKNQFWFQSKFDFFLEGLPWITTLLPPNEAGQGIFTVSNVQNRLGGLLKLSSLIAYPRSTLPSQSIPHIQINFWWDWDQFFDDINP